MSRSMFRLLSLLYFFLLHQQVLAQTTTSSTPGGSVSTTPSNSATLTPSPASSSSTPPDVYLNVPTLSVGRIELDVDDLRADINLNAQVASLVTLNAGVALSIQEVNLTISDIDAELELIVRLGHLVDIVNRVFESLDLNPLLISAINNVTSLLEPIVGAIDGLLGSITQGGTTLSFLIDNLGNIVQEVNGVSTIVGNYLTNMTDTGVSQTLSGGLIEKTYSYAPLNALVDIVFNAAGQVVQASVQKQSGSGGSTTTSSTSASKYRSGDNANQVDYKRKIVNEADETARPGWSLVLISSTILRVRQCCNSYDPGHDQIEMLQKLYIAEEMKTECILGRTS